jgi:hypothetical protein
MAYSLVLKNKKKIMISKISGLPAGNAGFKLSGKISKADVDHMIVPVVEKAASVTPILNVLLVLDFDFANPYEIADSLMGLKNLASFRRIALVSDTEASRVKELAAIISESIAAEYKNFTIVELVPATIWVGGSATIAK